MLQQQLLKRIFLPRRQQVFTSSNVSNVLRRSTDRSFSTTVRPLGNNNASTEEHLQQFTIKPHINFQHVAQNAQLHAQNVKNRAIADVDVSQIVSLYYEYTTLLNHTNRIRNWRRLIADYMASKISAKDMPTDLVQFALGQNNSVEQQQQQQRDTLTEDVEKEWVRLQTLRQYPNPQKQPNGVMSKEEKDLWQSKGKELKDVCTEKEHEVAHAFNTLLKVGSRLPNLTHPETPIGEEPALLDEVGSKEEVKAGKKNIYDSYDICLKLDIADFDRASLISGSKFYYLKNEGVLLEYALIQYAISKLLKYGFTLTTTPELVRRDVIEACGFQPRGEHSQIYNIQDSDLCLTGTSEISLAGMFANKIIENFEPLPQKLAAISHCFRTEAGAGGRRDKGLYRVHQFTKVEMFAVTNEHQSEDMLKLLVSIQKEIFADLGLHFKVLNMPSTDLGAPAFNKIDIEAYMAGKDMYGEVSSASNCTDYQSRRLNIKLRTVDPQTKQQINVHAHTLNATGIAVPRAIIAILETNQFEDENGRIGVRIPEVLQPYMQGVKVIMEKERNKSHNTVI